MLYSSLDGYELIEYVEFCIYVTIGCVRKQLDVYISDVCYIMKTPSSIVQKSSYWNVVGILMTENCGKVVGKLLEC